MISLLFFLPLPPLDVLASADANTSVGESFLSYSHGARPQYSRLIDCKLQASALWYPLLILTGPTIATQENFKAFSKLSRTD